MRGERRTWIAIGAVVVAVIALNLALGAADRATRGPGGRTSSSYATQSSGLAAYADLLARFGHPVRRIRDLPRDADLDPASTVVVLDAESLSRADAVALHRFAKRGGRLVVGGADSPAQWTGALIGAAAPSWQPSGSQRATLIVPVPEASGVRSVSSSGRGSWRNTTAALPAVGGRASTLLAVAAVGRGRVALLADASPLQNRLLAQRDNAVLGLALAGERDRPVAFVESVHGYGRASGLAAVPARWWWALGGLFAAALVFMIARGRRLGPPEARSRELPPPRRAYVESVASLVARSKRPAEAIEPVQAAVRERIVRRLGVDVTGDGLARAATQLDMSADELRRALGTPSGERDVVAAGIVLARLEDGRAR